MDNKKLTDTMIERIKDFITVIENGKYDPIGYKFTVSMQLPNFKEVTFSDDNTKAI